MSGNLLVRFGEGRVGRTVCRPLSYSTGRRTPSWYAITPSTRRSCSIGSTSSSTSMRRSMRPAATCGVNSTAKERVSFKGTRWLLLKNPWNLSSGQKERFSTLVGWNSPLVRAWYLKESFQLFWTYKQPWRAKQHLLRWMNSAMRSRLEPFKKFVGMLRSHLDGVLAWTKTRLSNGAVEGMNNKIKSISHRSFGFRTAENFIAAIYHCCARLPLPVER